MNEGMNECSYWINYRYVTFQKEGDIQIDVLNVGTVLARQH